MPCKIATLLKKLKNKFHDAHVSIGIDYDVHRDKQEIEIEYTVYVHNDYETYHQQLKSLKELKDYVDALCDRLTVNQVLNACGETLIVE